MQAAHSLLVTQGQGASGPMVNYFLCLLIQFLRLWDGNFVASGVCPLVSETWSGPLVARSISSGVVCLEAALDVRWGLLSAPWLTGQGLLPRCWGRSHEGQDGSGFVALECVPCRKEGGC